MMSNSVNDAKAWIRKYFRDASSGPAGRTLGDEPRVWDFRLVKETK